MGADGFNSHGARVNYPTDKEQASPEKCLLKQFRVRSVSLMTENKISETEEICNCDVCQSWRDTENRMTGIFTMPKEAYEAAVEVFQRYAGDFPQLKDQPMSTFFGMMVGKGIMETAEEHVMTEIWKKISEKLPGMREDILK